jgi:predicted MFS family arabinose efflux permease
MITGVLVATAGLVAGALLRERALILVTAAAVGAGAAACRVTWSPALMRLASPSVRARAFTWNVALLMASAAGWNALAGAIPSIVARVGTIAALSGNQLVLIGSALVTLCAAPCYWVLRLEAPTTAHAHAPPASADVPVAALAHPATSRRGLAPAVWAVLACTALWMLTDALVNPFLNIYFTDRFALSVATVGSLFGVALAVRAVALSGAAELARRSGPPRALAGWMLVAVPCIAAMALVTSPAAAIGLFVVHGMIGPATNPLIDQLLLERVRAERHGTVAGWRNAGAELSGALGASVGGRLLEATSFTGLLLTAAGLAAFTGPALLVSLRRRAEGPA